MVDTIFRKELEEKFPNINERKAYVSKILLDRAKNSTGIGQQFFPSTHELRVYHTELHDKILAAAKRSLGR
jgi:hypothetical protein